MLVRSGGLAETMSRYLIQRISENPAIELHFNTEIVSMDGHTHLERVDWLDKSTGQTSTHQIHHVFMMAGHPLEPHGCAVVSPWMTRLHPYGRDLDGSPAPARQPLGRFRGLPRCWRPVFRAYLRWVMFDQAT